LIVVVAAFLSYACSDEISHKVEGYWKLQQVVSPDGDIQKVDTIFYGFQKQTAFSFTVLVSPDAMYQYYAYGYLYFPESNKIRIKMELNSDNLDAFLQYSGWSSSDETFLIDINGNKMRLVDSKERTFYFIKY
jgi:hypothetical protein